MKFDVSLEMGVIWTCRYVGGNKDKENNLYCKYQVVHFGLNIGYMN